MYHQQKTYCIGGVKYIKRMQFCSLRYELSPCFLNGRWLQQINAIHRIILWLWCQFCSWSYTLRWRHNGRDGVSNHQPHHCLLNHLFRRRSKKTSKLRVTGLCAGNSSVTGEFPAQLASNAENVYKSMISMKWYHYLTNDLKKYDSRVFF